MACRDRKKGLFGVTGGNINSRNKTTNTQLANQIEDLREELMDMKTKSKEADFNAKLQLTKIKKNQDWHIFLTCTIPLIAPKLSKAIGNLFANNKAEDLESFMKKVDPLMKEAPPELKGQIINVATNFFSKKNNNKSV
jgi:hypothetical protein